jgi:hypothetical protein
MATEKIGIEVEVKGAEKSISSFKDLKTAIKAAKDEQISMSEKFGGTSEQAKKAGQKLAELKDKVEDLNDSTKSLKGTGIERLTSSFRLLGEGIATFDFDKIKLGFKGVGAAMSAIPIFLIIEGLKLLYDNFEKVVEFFNVFYASTDTATRSLKKLNAAIEENSTLQNEMLQATDKNTKFAMLSAQQQGKSELEIQEIQRSGFEKRAKYASEYLKTTGENYDKILASELSTAEDRKNATKALNEARKSLDNELTNLEIFNLEKKIEANTKAEEKEKALKDKANEASKAAAEKAAAEAQAAAQKRLEDEKKLLADIENSKEQSYIKTLKTEQAQAIVKAQFQNDKLIEDINKSTASQATKDKALVQAEITLQENYAQIQKDYKIKQDAKEKEDAIKVLQTKLSIIESGYQLELEKDKTKNSIKLQNVEKGSEEEKAILENADQEKLIKAKAHLEEIYKINIANAKLLNLDTTNLTNKYLQEKEALENAARDKKTEADKKAEADEKARKKQLQKDIVESVNLAAQTTLAVSKTLSDTYYMKETQKINKLYADKLKNVKQGSKEEKAILDQKAKDEKDLARQQFETQKKFNRASAIMNGILGLGAIFAVPDPTLGVMSAIRAIALVATTAANVAQINSTQFDEGGSSAGGIPAAETSAPSTAQAPSIYGPGQGQSTTFSGNQNNNFAPVKAYVVETENRSTTNRVNKLVSESTYG